MVYVWQWQVYTRKGNLSERMYYGIVNKSLFVHEQNTFTDKDRNWIA